MTIPARTEASSPFSERCLPIPDHKTGAYRVVAVSRNNERKAKNPRFGDSALVGEFDVGQCRLRGWLPAPAPDPPAIAAHEQTCEAIGP